MKIRGSQCEKNGPTISSQILQERGPIFVNKQPIQPPQEVGQVVGEGVSGVNFPPNFPVNRTGVSPIRVQSNPKRRPRPRDRIAMVMSIPVKFPNGYIRNIEFLVDTGSEVNLIQRNLVPPACWAEPKTKHNLCTATNAPLRGGQKVCQVFMLFNAVKVGEEEKGHTPEFLDGELFDGDISNVEGILSYTWLLKNKLAVFPHRGCLMKEDSPLLWLFGAEVENIIDDWEGAPKWAGDPARKAKKVENHPDDLSSEKLSHILLTHGWSARTETEISDELERKKAINRISIVEDLEKWCLKPSERYGETPLTFEELETIAGYIAEAELDIESREKKVGVW